MAQALNTLADLRTAILEKLSRTEPCDIYQDVVNASNYDALIRTGCGNMAWTIQTLLSDDMISAFPESIINSYGIYINSINLTNPTGYLGCKDYTIDDEQAPEQVQSIYFLYNNNYSLVINNKQKYRVYLMFGATLNAEVSNDSWLSVMSFNDSESTINVFQFSSLNFHANNKSHITLTANNNANIFGELRGNSQVSYVGNNESVGNFKTFANSTLGYIIYDSAEVNTVKFNKSTINQNAQP